MFVLTASLHSDRKQRLTEAVESALRLGGGTWPSRASRLPTTMRNSSENSNAHATQQGQTIAWSEGILHVREHGAFMPELSPRVSRSTSPLGACGTCQGLGVQRQFNVDLIAGRQHERLERLRYPGANPCHPGTATSSAPATITASQQRFRLRCWMKMRKTSSFTVQARPSFITNSPPKTAQYKYSKPWEGTFRALRKPTLKPHRIAPEIASFPA